MFIKLRAKGRNNSQHCWPNNNESCCVRLHWLNVWPVSKSAQHLPTTRNNMHRGVKKKATCNIQLCRELVASKMSDVGPVCTGLYMCKCCFFWLCTRCILTLFYHTLQLFVSPSKTYKKNDWRLPNFFFGNFTVLTFANRTARLCSIPLFFAWQNRARSDWARDKPILQHK